MEVAVVDMNEITKGAYLVDAVMVEVNTMVVTIVREVVTVEKIYGGEDKERRHLKEKS